MMDDEARRRLETQALLQHARAEAKRGRANMPYGIGMIIGGAAIAIAGLSAPVGLIGHAFIVGIGFILIPLGVAVVVRASVAIARESKVARELAPPSARIVE